jgi:hypothetical protein
MAKRNDYEVGYKKPPKDTRFKKGQSGNPAGRPKAQPIQEDFASALHEEGQTLISVTEYGRVRKMSKARALAKAEFNKALKGDQAAVRTILSMMPKSRPQAAPDVPALVDTTADEAKKDFDAYLDGLSQRAANRGEKPWPQNDNTHATGAANSAKSNDDLRRNEG